MNKIEAVRRKIIQVVYALLTNLHIPGFFSGDIYTGKLKQVCVPGLNCYSCPGALGSCPIGALQNAFSDPSYKMSYYVIGLLSIFGLFLGRLVCGFLCPFGLIQELFFMPLQFLKKRYSSVKNFFEKKRLPLIFRYAKYVILAVFVIILPLFVVDAFGFGDPWFCKYICPSGMVMGALPLLSADSRLLDLLGYVFQIKLLVCVVVLSACLISYRFFCKYLCPLGAIYGLFNKISFYSMQIDTIKCTNCQACSSACKMGVSPNKSPNNAECIRCGKCRGACKTKAISLNWGIFKKR